MSYKDRDRKRASALEILIHLSMAPTSGGTFSWQLAPDQKNRLATDLRWIVLRKIFTELNGRSPYKALIQKHAVRVDSLDREFFSEILEVVRQRHAKSIDIFKIRELSEIELVETYFIPLILEWSESERSTSVSRERTPSMEELVTHEDASGNIYTRFPDEFSWALTQYSPGREVEEAREIPDDMKVYVRRIADELTNALRKLLRKKKFEKYILLLSRLEDNVCTWELTYDYLKQLGVTRYSSWKSLSVVANRAMNEFVKSLPDDVKTALHQDDPDLTREEKHKRLRLAVTAALEINPLPSPKELIANAG